MPKPTDRWVEVGALGRAHGVRGELYVRLYNPDSPLLTEGRRLRVGDGALATDLGVATARWTAKGWLVRFEGVGHREAAAALTNCKLYVRRSELPDLDADEVYQEDLVGLLAVTETGRHLGVVIGFFDNGAHDVCVIRTAEGGEVLLPFREDALIDVRPEADEVVLAVPDGIPGLDSAETEEAAS